MSHHLDLAALGLDGLKRVYWNLSAPALVEEAIKRDEGALAEHGPLIVRTGTHTGRSPNDKFTVKEATSSDKIWWGKVNIPFEEKKFDALFNRVKTYLKGKEVFVQDCFAGADPEFQVPIRVVTEFAWQNLFAQNLFIRSEGLSEKNEKPFTVISVPGLQAIPTQDGTASETFIIANLERRIVLIGGSRYAGEIKKSIFFVLNYLLPLKGVLSMHCSANIGKENDVAVFFGLSGTGKTTLSADPERKLIGDDEHGWSEHGVFNFEGGCYAKMIKLNPEAEPEIFSTTRKFGTVLENVGYDVDSRALDLNDDTLTENTRAAYPLTHLSNIEPSGMGGHPRNIIMLTADAFGVMPPIAKLTPEQAMYHFLSGYTAKVAGTERGIKEPQATFSTCFGA
ncbi:MAG TPA: phosphoenolpyruvate carboxykinase (ATP), partial [Cyanobacteria bacterium UBA8530]|nr:phosphoenolpyruvate carboxykinase (ATP) [Cyanobacteria bacterium UBA8530]